MKRARRGAGGPADSRNDWDHYAPFYDWENARTMGRRDVRFWQRVAAEHDGAVLELGCGTGRILAPLARDGVRAVGIDLADAMLAGGRRRLSRIPPKRRPTLVRGDLRALPFRARSFCAVIAAYGVLQSLTSDRDLDAALAEAARVLRRGGEFGLDLVPDLPAWPTYERAVRLTGKLRAAHVTLVETVRQDRRRGLTVFDETFITRARGQNHRQSFSLTFRTVPMDRMLTMVDRAGFDIQAVQGDYRGGAWSEGAETWLIRAVRR